jgi:hypothetical protein
MGMGMDLMPFGMPMQQNFLSPFSQISQMMNGMTAEMMNPSTPAFSHSQVSYMTVAPDATGRPQVYQASTTTRQGPGGVRETRKAVSDSRTGTKKLHVGRHLGERAHILEREENLYTGQREEHEDLVNLDHEEKHQFDREWRNRVYGGGGYERASITAQPAISDGRAPSSSATYGPGVTIEEVDDDEEIVEQAALPSSAPTVHHPPSPSRRHHQRDRGHKSSKRPKRHH